MKKITFLTIIIVTIQLFYNSFNSTTTEINHDNIELNYYELSPSEVIFSSQNTQLPDSVVDYYHRKAKQYISSHIPFVKIVCNKNEVVTPSILLAQSMLESNFGTTLLYLEGNNIFWHHCLSSDNIGCIKISNKYYDSFDNLMGSYERQIYFYKNNNFEDLHGQDDYKLFSNRLQEIQYSADSNYEFHLNFLIEKFNLDMYD